MQTVKSCVSNMHKMLYDWATRSELSRLNRVYRVAGLTSHSERVRKVETLGGC